MFIVVSQAAASIMVALVFALCLMGGLVLAFPQHSDDLQACGVAFYHPSKVGM